MNRVNVLEEGVWELEKLRDQLISLEQYKAKLSSFDLIEQKMEKGIHDKEVQINEEITTVVGRREREIAASYDEQIERQNSKIKKVREKKAKNKTEKVNERVASETSSLREENAKLADEVSYLFKDGKVNRMFNTRFYFAMLAPKGFTDFMIMLVFLLVSLVAIPKFFYLMIAPKNHVLFYTVVYLIDIAIIVIGYYIAYHATKLKNPEVIQKARERRYEIRKNQRQIKKIKRKIVKDKDESIYNLESYDKEIRKVEDKARDIEKEKNEALATLKNTTSNILANEVRAKHQMELSELHKVYKEQQESTHQIEEEVREMMSKLTNDYQVYLGKDIMNVTAVDELIGIMNSQNVRAVSEALHVYRADEAQRLQALEQKK